MTRSTCELARTLAALLLVIGCGNRAPRSDAPKRDASVDAAVEVLVDAPADAPADAAVDAPVDAAALREAALGVIPAGGRREIDADPRTLTTWQWRGPGGEVSGRVRWVRSPDDEQVWHVDIELTSDGATVWSCPQPECALECSNEMRCDVGLVARRDRLFIATMWMNKLEYLPEKGVQVRWRRGAIEVTDIDPCAVGRTGLWDASC